MVRLGYLFSAVARKHRNSLQTAKSLFIKKTYLSETQLCTDVSNFSWQMTCNDHHVWSL